MMMPRRPSCENPPRFASCLSSANVVETDADQSSEMSKSNPALTAPFFAKPDCWPSPTSFVKLYATCTDDAPGTGLTKNGFVLGTVYTPPPAADLSTNLRLE